jgi:hypothetical protein
VAPIWAAATSLSTKPVPWRSVLPVVKAVTEAAEVVATVEVAAEVVATVEVAAEVVATVEVAAEVVATVEVAAVDIVTAMAVGIRTAVPAKITAKPESSFFKERPGSSRAVFFFAINERSDRVSGGLQDACRLMQSLLPFL